MQTMTIDPATMTVTPTTVDLKDFRSIQNAIEGKSFEELRPFPGIRIFVDQNAKLYPVRPARFLIPLGAGKAPLDLYGKALIILNKGRPMPEIVFPMERRVTSLDLDFRNLSLFVSTKAGRDPEGLNFHAILSDERFIAACRVVLATFEKHILNACPSVDFCPSLELEITQNHLIDALDLYDELTTEFGYSDDEDEEEEDEEDEIETPNLLAQMHAYMAGR